MRGQSIELALEVGLQVLIVGQFDQFAEVGKRPIEILPLLDPGPKFADPAHHALGVVGVVPESIDSALMFEVG